MKNRRFLAIWILNVVLFIFDLYIISVAAANRNGQPESPSTIVEGLMGAVLGSNDLIYLIMIPMYMAKNHSEQVAEDSLTFRLCYAGTIVGVVLALCTVGKFLFSQNLAIFLSYCTKKASETTQAPNDIILCLLLIIANLIIYKPVWAEYKTSWLYKRCNRREEDGVALSLDVQDLDTDRQKTER
jgi:hypothetical protein